MLLASVQFYKYSNISCSKCFANLMPKRHNDTEQRAKKKKREYCKKRVIKYPVSKSTFLHKTYMINRLCLSSEENNSPWPAVSESVQRCIQHHTWCSCWFGLFHLFNGFFEVSLLDGSDEVFLWTVQKQVCWQHFIYTVSLKLNRNWWEQKRHWFVSQTLMRELLHFFSFIANKTGLLSA